MESIRKSKFYCSNNFHYDNELANNIRPSGAQVIIMYIIPPMCIYIEIYMTRSLYFLSREWHFLNILYLCQSKQNCQRFFFFWKKITVGGISYKI